MVSLKVCPSGQRYLLSTYSIATLRVRLGKLRARVWYLDITSRSPAGGLDRSSTVLLQKYGVESLRVRFGHLNLFVLPVVVRGVVQNNNRFLCLCRNAPQKLALGGLNTISGTLHRLPRRNGLCPQSPLSFAVFDEELPELSLVLLPNLIHIRNGFKNFSGKLPYFYAYLAESVPFSHFVFFPRERMSYSINPSYHARFFTWN